MKTLTHALRKRGWTISAIARHLGPDRKTIRAYLTGREPGVRDRSTPDRFEEFQVYAAQRLRDDPHPWAMTLFDELLQLGYDRSYPTLTRQLRERGLRPACEACAPAKGRPVAVIEHPPGQETQWDWAWLPDPPEHWGWGKTAHLLVGALSHSGIWRAVLCESEEQPHLIDGLHRFRVRRRWGCHRLRSSPRKPRVPGRHPGPAGRHPVHRRALLRLFGRGLPRVATPAHRRPACGRSTSWPGLSSPGPSR